MAKFKHIFLAFICVIVGSFVFTGCNFSDDGNYSITVNQNEHGTVTVDKTTAKENEKVTITATADEGYVLYALLCDGTVLDSNIVTMPAKNIVVSAIFEQVSDQTIALGKGNYVQLAYVDEDGIYSENGTFFNSISIKE